MRSTPIAQLPSMASLSSSSKPSHPSPAFKATPTNSRPPSCPPMHNNSKGDGMVIIRDEQFASFYLPSPTCQSWGIASHEGILLGDSLSQPLQSDNFHHHAPVADVDTCVADILQLMNSPSPSLSFSSSYPSSTSTVPSSEGSMHVLRSILLGHSSSISNGITSSSSSSSSRSLGISSSSTSSTSSNNKPTTRSLMNTAGIRSRGEGASAGFNHTPLQGQGLANGQGLKGCVDMSTRASPGTSPCTSAGSDSCAPTGHSSGLGNTFGNNNKSTTMSLEEFLSSNWIMSAGCDSTGLIPQGQFYLQPSILAEPKLPSLAQLTGQGLAAKGQGLELGLLKFGQGQGRGFASGPGLASGLELGPEDTCSTKTSTSTKTRASSRLAHMSTTSLASSGSVVSGGNDGGDLLKKASGLTSKGTVSGLGRGSAGGESRVGMGRGVGLGMKKKNAVYGGGHEDFSWLLALKPPSTQVTRPSVPHPRVPPVKSTSGIHLPIRKRPAPCSATEDTQGQGLGTGTGLASGPGLVHGEGQGLPATTNVTIAETTEKKRRQRKLKYVGLGEKKRKPKDPNAPPKEKKEKKEKKVKKEKGMKKEKGAKKEKGVKRQGQEEEWQQGLLGTGPLKKRRRLEMGMNGQETGPELWLGSGQGFGVEPPIQHSHGGTASSNNNNDGYYDGSNLDDGYGMFKQGFGRAFGSSDRNNPYGLGIADGDFGEGNLGRSRTGHGGSGSSSSVGSSSGLLRGGLHSSGGSLGGGGLLGKRHRHGRSKKSSLIEGGMSYSEGGIPMNGGMSEECLNAMAGGSLHLLIQTASSADPSFFDSNNDDQNYNRHHHHNFEGTSSRDGPLAPSSSSSSSSSSAMPSQRLTYLSSSASGASEPPVGGYSYPRPVGATTMPWMLDSFSPYSAGEPPNTTNSTTSSGFPDFDDVVRVGGLPSPSVFAHSTATPTLHPNPLEQSHDHHHNPNHDPNHDHNPTTDAHTHTHLNSTSDLHLQPTPSTNRDAFDLIESCLHNIQPLPHPTGDDGI